METLNTEMTKTTDRTGEVLVRVEGVSKRFCRDLKRSLFYGVQDIASDLIGCNRSESELRKDEFWANDDISFELRRGECLGLIGHNGAGKTTLLKMLNGLIKPDRGRVEMKGYVGALIALGAGFNPILTGRENAYIAGAVLGFSKSFVASCYDEIVDFSGLSDYMDSPVQNYSSGMQVRLGFAVATVMNPDILLVDEVLAVGDYGFRFKCYNRIRELLPTTAIIVVSHNMYNISRVCDRVLVLNDGRSCFLGEVGAGIDYYNDLNSSALREGSSGLKFHVDNRISSFEVIDYQMDSNGIETSVYLRFRMISDLSFGAVRVRVVFFDNSKQAVAEWDSMYYKESEFFLYEGSNEFELSIHRIRLRSGAYSMALLVCDLDNRGYYLNVEEGLSLVIKNQVKAGAVYKI